MAFTRTLGRATRVPTDRQIRVRVVSPQNRSETDLVMRDRMASIDSELRRHMAVVSSKQSKPPAVPGDWAFEADGIASRDWTRGELEAQLLFLRIQFATVTIKSEPSATMRPPAGRERVYSPSIVAEEVERAVTGEDTPMEPPSKLPLILGGVALVVGVGIAYWAVTA